MKLRILTVVVAAAAIISSCSKPITDPKDPKFVVAKAKKFSITRDELTKERDFRLKTSMSGAAIDPSSLPEQYVSQLDHQVLEGMITLKAVLARATAEQKQKAEKKAAEDLKGLEEKAGGGDALKSKLEEAGLDLDHFLKSMKDEILAQEIILSMLPEDVKTVSAGELQTFYDENPERFDQPEQATVRHIMVALAPDDDDKARDEKKKKINDAHKRISKGADFGEVAMEVSDDKASARKGGEIGPFPKGKDRSRLPEEFDKAAFSQKIGKLGPVFSTAYGYHFIEVTDRKPAKKLTLDEVSGDLRQILSSRKEQKAVTEKLRVIREDVKVEILLPEPEEQPETATAMAPQMMTPSQPSQPSPSQPTPPQAGEQKSEKVDGEQK